MQGTICIYKVVNPIGEMYIGQTINFEKRVMHYRNSRCQRQVKLYASFKKYGMKSHEFVIIETIKEADVSQKLLDEKERHYISLYDTMKNGLNCQSGGKKGFESCEETRLKHKNRVSPPVTELTRQRISEANKGRIASEETKRKQSMALKGRVVPKEELEKAKKAIALSISKMSDEERIRRFTSNKGKGIEVYDKNSTLLHSFDAMAFCLLNMKKIYNIDFFHTHIYSCCNGKTKQYKGFIFKYKK